ncbi:MAG: OmpA family protein, partial [Candidatus Kapabacteria bacterium]|nr:OmpA family protein [Candidatus Kapabacteria bacterium]MDW7997807.1 OmpA family protein [Bacteroidota bacterium]
QMPSWSRPASSLRSGEPLFADIWRIDARSYPQEVSLFVRIRDNAGTPITHLAPPYAEDVWRQYWRGLGEQLGLSHVPIDSFTVREYNDWDTTGYALALLLDYSGSMTSVLTLLQGAAEDLIRLKKPYDAIALASFSERLELLSPMERETPQLLERFRQTRFRGIGVYTAVYDALLEGITLLQRVDSPMRVLILFSDGDDNASQTSALQVYEAAQAANVRIFTVGFGYTQDSLLAALASYTGGRYYPLNRPEELSSALNEIYRSLRNFYLVRYRPPLYAGLHRVHLYLTLLGDTVPAHGEYDTAPITPFDTVGKQFERIILFDFDKATLRPEAVPIVEELAELLKRYPRIRLEVQGHTDNVGTPEYNQRLSEARAQAVVDALVERGIDRRRLRPRGFGMTMPVAPNDTEENRQRNRRTVFKIIAK